MILLIKSLKNIFLFFVYLLLTSIFFHLQSKPIEDAEHEQKVKKNFYKKIRERVKK